MAVCDINKETKQVVQDLNNAQVRKIKLIVWIDIRVWTEVDFVVVERILQM